MGTHKTIKKYPWVLYGVFLLAILGNIAFWIPSKKTLPNWANVPFAPSRESIMASSVADDEIAYRMIGYFLQNAGNVGGRYESLRSYDYKSLGDWFFLSQSLDERSNFVPFLAAYYYGGLDEKTEKLDYVIDYLTSQGQLEYPQKWRWLAQAVFFARYKQKDLPKALRIANLVTNLKTDVAPWARQLPAFVHLNMGDKQAAYEIMIRMLSTEAERLHPNEVNEMVNFICKRALEPPEAAKNPLCQKPK